MGIRKNIATKVSKSILKRGPCYCSNWFFYTDEEDLDESELSPECGTCAHNNAILDVFEDYVCGGLPVQKVVKKITDLVPDLDNLSIMKILSKLEDLKKKEEERDKRKVSRKIKHCHPMQQKPKKQKPPRNYREGTD